jgi:glycosyltransferase involved in cell wall biosynthesis
MVTRNRAALAHRAIHCFAQQTWPNRELVVLDDGDEDYGPIIESFVAAGVRIRYHRVAERAGVRLGQLRNEAIDLADGEWCMQWDDDEWYHPARIETQMAARARGVGVALQWTLVRLESPTLGLLQFRADSGIATPGTVLHRRDAARYQNLAKNEDGLFLREVRSSGLTVLGKEASHLFVRCFHGTNTWDEQHFLRRLRRRPADWLPYVRARAAGELRRHPAFDLAPRERSTIEDLQRWDSTEARVG